MRSTLLASAALAAVVISGSGAAGQPVAWITQSAAPSGSHLNEVVFVTPERGFIVGDNTTFLRTDDGGGTWTRVSGTATGGEPYTGIRFHEDGMLGFLFGNVCLRTTDGGLTWNPIPGLPLGSWSHVDFGASAMSVFMGSNGAVAFSPDGGVTWEVPSGYPDCPIVESMDFVDDTLGLVGGRRIQPYDEGLYRTTDGGATWTRVLEDIGRNIRWLSPTVVEATTHNGIIRSVDAGLTWQIVGSEPLYPLGTTDALDLGEGIHVCVTSMGEIHRSHDGFSFFRTYGPLSDIPDETWAITRTPAGVLWVVGKYGFILRSDDEGFTWTQASSGMGLLANDMDMLTDNFGMAVGGNGFVWRTTDGGRHWTVTRPFEEPLFIGNTSGLTAVDVVSETFAIAGGVHGLLLRSFDGGLSWQNMGYPAIPPETAFTDLSFVDPDNGWAIINGVLNRTSTGGSLWDPVPGVTGSAVHFLDAQRGWVLDNQGLVRRTTDGGQTWLASGLPGDPLVLEGMTWLNATTGWVFGRFGYCAKTANGGASWQLQNIGGQNVSLFDVAARSATEVWGVGYDNLYNNIVLRSLNGGASWSRFIHNNGLPTLEHIRVRPDGGLVIAGFLGHVMTDRLPRLCTADWNADDAVNSSDISSFLTAWLASVQGGTMIGDVSGDGQVNSSDISDFLTEWLAATLAGGC